MEEQEAWEVDTALYGFRQSPKWWSDFRNAKAKHAEFDAICDGKRVRAELKVCKTDPNLFKIVTKATSSSTITNPKATSSSTITNPEATSSSTITNPKATSSSTITNPEATSSSTITNPEATSSSTNTNPEGLPKVRVLGASGSTMSPEGLCHYESEEGSTILGYVLFYVDDMLCVGETQTVSGFYEWLRSEWDTSGVQWITKNNMVRFLGMELTRVDTGYVMSQQGYLDEIIRAHECGGHGVIPAGKDLLVVGTNFPDPQHLDTKEIKEAQQRCGELLWTVQKTRPDASFAVTILASLTTRDPTRANVIAKKILNYFNSTKECSMMTGEIECPGGEKTLTLFTDASFAPEGERSHGGALVVWRGTAITWRSWRQGMTTLSSAESEVLSITEGVQLMLAVRATLMDMGLGPVQCQVMVDSTAAIAILQGDGGSWRTRHLKLRYHWLRELVQRDQVRLIHCPGDWQLADVLTKQVPSVRLRHMMRLWGMRGTGLDMGPRVRMLQPEPEGEDLEPPLEEWLENPEHDELQAMIGSDVEPLFEPRGTDSSESLGPNHDNAYYDRVARRYFDEYYAEWVSSPEPSPRQQVNQGELQQPATYQHETTQQTTGPSYTLTWGLRLGWLVSLFCCVKGEGDNLALGLERYDLERLQAGLEVAAPWDLYIAVMIVAIVAILVWECVRGCGREVKDLVAIRAMRLPPRASHPLNRAELRRLQALLKRDMMLLSELERREMLELGARFQQSDGGGSSTNAQVQDQGGAASFSVDGLVVSAGKVEASVQTDPYVPSATRLQPSQESVRIRVIETAYNGPYYMSSSGSTVHTTPDCWGLRNVQTPLSRTLCQVCERRARESAMGAS